MKRILAIVLAALMLLALFGCGSSTSKAQSAAKSAPKEATPQDAVKEMVAAYKTGDLKKFYAAFSDGKNPFGESKDTSDTPLSSKDDTSAADFLRIMSQKLTITLAEVKTSETTASATAKITNADFASVMSDMLTYAFSNIGKETSDAEDQAMFMQLMKKKLDLGETKNFEIPLTFKKSGGKWTIDGSEALGNALTGGLSGASSALESATK